jgi:hypothetical protein
MLDDRRRDQVALLLFHELVGQAVSPILTTSQLRADQGETGVSILHFA